MFVGLLCGHRLEGVQCGGGVGPCRVGGLELGLEPLVLRAESSDGLHVLVDAGAGQLVRDVVQPPFEPADLALGGAEPLLCVAQRSFVLPAAGAWLW